MSLQNAKIVISYMIEIMQWKMVSKHSINSL